MSRSVSAPSSVTNTSPCWNGLIVPGSTFRYGSNFCTWTLRPRAFRSRPSDAATIPFPRPETTPPVTNTYFVARSVVTQSPRDANVACAADGAVFQESAAVWTSAWSRLRARCGNERPRPMSHGPLTASVARVRSGAEASSRSSASIRSPVSWKTSRSGGAAASTSSIPVGFGLRKMLGRFVPRICQRAPAARPRRSGSTAAIPGHQSAKWRGAARKAQTSSRGARSRRAASTRGTGGRLAPGQDERDRDEAADADRHRQIGAVQQHAVRRDEVRDPAPPRERARDVPEGAAGEGSGGQVERPRARERGGDEEQHHDEGERRELRRRARVEANGLERAGGRHPLRREVEHAREGGHASGQGEMCAPAHSELGHRACAFQTLLSPLCMDAKNAGDSTG